MRKTFSLLYFCFVTLPPIVLSGKGRNWHTVTLYSRKLVLERLQLGAEDFQETATMHLNQFRSSVANVGSAVRSNGQWGAGEVKDETHVPKARA